MHRIALDVDPIAVVRNMLGKKEPDPLSAIILAELGGAESIVCYLRDDAKTVSERDVQLFRQVVKTHLNVKSNINEENIRKLIRLKVDMITFVAPGAVNSKAAAPLNVENYATQLQNYIAELRSNNILSSILIEPEIGEVKAAGKLEFDYVELDASALTTSEDMQEELSALENFSSMALAANKLGMGVNISGGIGYENVREVAALDFIEDIIIGEPVLIKSLYIGFEQALRDLQALI